ncbi:Nlrc3 [Symbiodinium natans]|uniref:Nlrc3 protein n=1 Tax=Symbiodinium natans TaxID=878477 RepID=A0A812P2I4_9DINO|nr:Nlrc3 [Symbiodinium natans]
MAAKEPELLIRAKTFDQIDGIAAKCVALGVPTTCELVVEIADDHDARLSYRPPLSEQVPGSRSATHQGFRLRDGQDQFCTCDLDQRHKSQFDLMRERSCQQAQERWLEVTKLYNQLVESGVFHHEAYSVPGAGVPPEGFATDAVMLEARAMEADLTMCYCNLGGWQDRMREIRRKYGL